jgi:hypothetical protein
MTIRLLLLLLITNVCVAQDFETMHQDLAAKVNEINRYRDHKVVKIESEAIADVFEGQAWLTGFYKDEAIRKITLVIESDLATAAYNYYFDSGNLIYITESIDKFTSSDKLKTNRTFSGKYFFKDNKMFDHEGTGSNRFDDQSLNAETILLAETKKNVDLLNKLKNNAVGLRN